jgi:hypothetical protein
MRNGIKMPVLLVAAMAAAFITGRRDPAARQDSEASVQPKETEPVAAPLIPELVETDLPFSWARVEASDLIEFVNNLQQVSCPQRTVIDLVKGRLRRESAAKAPRNFMMNAADQVQRRLRDEAAVDAVVYGQLKLRRPARSANVLFTAEQEEAVAVAFARYPALQPDPTNPLVSEQATSNKVARITFLAPQFSEEQMVYYKLDREEEVYRVYRVFGGIDTSKEEFLAVAVALEAAEIRAINGQLPPETINTLGKVLSPERLTLVQDLQKPQYQAIRDFGLSRQVAPYAVNSLMRLRREIFPSDINAYTRGVRQTLKEQRLADDFLRTRRIHLGKEL